MQYGQKMAVNRKTAVKTWRSLPPQKVSAQTKSTKTWQENCVAAIVGMSQARGDNGRSSRTNKQINYDIVNSRFRQSDFDNVLNPYGIKSKKYGGNPVKMQNYNLIRPKLETLKGEEMKMGINFKALAINGEAVNEKREALRKVIVETAKARMQAVAANDIDPETGEPNAPTVEQAVEDFKNKWSSPVEIATNRLLRYIIQNDMLQMKFAQGWEHSMISTEEVYYCSIKGGHPSARVVNPLNLSFDRELENPFLHLAEWAMEERWMPAGSVIDEFGEHMSDALVRKIDDGELGGTSVMSNGMARDFAYKFDGGMRMNAGMAVDTSHIYVAHCTWRSWKKIGYLKYQDPRTGQIQQTIVDERFNLDLSMFPGATINWDWVSEIWEGTRIGYDDYINIHPVENQTGYLPYVGYIYNNVNSIATSLVDMVKPHQYTYIIVWYRMELEIAKAKGKKFVMDIAQLPKSKGWNVDQWMYYFDNLGVAWVNSLEEGRKGDPNSVSKFNQFTNVDMSLSKVISEYMLILQKLEQQVEVITGVSRQREGDIKSNETATGAQRAIIQSTNNTKPLFFYHDICKKTVLEYMVELSKIAYADGLEVEYALDENTVETLSITAGMLNGTDLGVFMVNSFEENENINKLEQYLNIALQSNQATLKDIASVLGSKSMSEIRSQLIASADAAEARELEKQELDRKAQIESSENILLNGREQREMDKYKTDMDYKKGIDVATIQAAAKQAEGDEVPLGPGEEPISEKESEDLRLKEKQIDETIRNNKKKNELDAKKIAQSAQKSASQN